MSFVFASSHLPEVERPEDEDEEEEEDMQRSGMVRAFSHLPQPVRAAPVAPRSSSPAPASRPAWAAAPEAPSGHEADEGHDAEPDDDADDGHGSSASTGAHEPDDGRPWYQPRITAADLQPEGGGHDDPAPGSSGRPAKKWEPEHDPDPGFDGTLPKAWGTPTRDAGFDASPQDVHNGNPDTSDEAPAPRRAPFPQSRLFEKRPTPGFSASTSGPESNDLVYRTQSSPVEEKENGRSLFQNVAARGPAPQQSTQRPQSTIQPRAANAAPMPQPPQSKIPARAAYAEQIRQGITPPRMVFDEAGPSWFGNPADLSAQAGTMGLEYSKQSNPTLAEIRKRSQTLGQGDIYVYSGHGGHVDGKPHLAAHGEADESKGEVPIQYPRVGLTGSYKQNGTGLPVSQLQDDIAQGKNGVPMMAFISGCEVGAKDLSGLNDAGVSVAVSAGGKASERDAPRQMQTFMDVLTKGGTINDALKAVNEIVEQDNRHKFNEEDMQEPFTAVFRDGINGGSTLEDVRRHNAQINGARKAGEKKAGTPKP